MAKNTEYIEFLDKMLAKVNAQSSLQSEEKNKQELIASFAENNDNINLTPRADVDDFDDYEDHCHEDYPCLDEVPDELRDDKEYVIDAVQVWGDNLMYASKRLRADADVVLAAFEGMAYFKEKHILSWANQKFRDDLGFLISMFNKKREVIEEGHYANGYDFRGVYRHEVLWASENLRYNKQFALAVVSIFGRAIEDFSEAIRQDKEIVQVAVDNGAPLRFIPEQFRGDKQIVKSALKNTVSYTGYKYKNFEIILNLKYMSEDLQNDLEFFKELLEDAENFDKNFCCSDKFNSDDYDPCDPANNYNAKTLLQYCPSFVREFAEVAKNQSIADKKASQVLSKELLNDKLYVKELLKDSTNVTLLGDAIQDKDYMLQLAEIGVDIAEFLPLPMRFDREFMLKLIKININYKQILPPRLLRDKEFMREVKSLEGKKSFFDFFKKRK